MSILFKPLPDTIIAHRSGITRKKISLCKFKNKKKFVKSNVCKITLGIPNQGPESSKRAVPTLFLLVPETFLSEIKKNIH